MRLSSFGKRIADETRDGGGNLGGIGDGKIEFAPPDVFAENQQASGGEMRGERGMAALAERGEKRAFDGNGECRFRVRGAGKKFRVAGTRLQRDRRLRRRRHHFFERKRTERESGKIGDSEPRQPRRGEKSRVGVPVGDFFQTRADVPAHFAKFRVRKKTLSLRAAARRSRGDFRGNAPARRGAADENVARVGAAQTAGEPRSRRERGRQILAAVDCGVDFAGNQRVFQLVGEKSLPARFFERPFEAAVAFGNENFQRDFRVGRDFRERGAGFFRLSERERTPARAERQFLFLFRFRHFGKKLNRVLARSESIFRLPEFSEKRTLERVNPKQEERNAKKAPAPRGINVPAGLGLFFALLSLAFLRTPTTCGALWCVGAIFSVSGFFSKPRDLAFFGAGASLLCVFFSIIFFGSESVFIRATDFPAFRFREERKAPETAAPAAHEKTPAKAATVRPTVPAREYKYEESADEDEAPSADDYPPPARSEDEADDAVPAEEKSLAQLPVAAFATIARNRARWPQSVRTARPRSVLLMHEKTREIIGRMEVPTGTQVRILEVREDGALRVLDSCTGQIFLILAADTDFAEKYAERNFGGR